MRPKSGLPKRRALRNMPAFSYGFKTNPQNESYRNPAVNGKPKSGSYEVMSMFSGCGGLDLGFLGGFTYQKTLYSALPYQIVQAVDIEDRAVETYRLNLGEHAIVGDLTEIPVQDLPKCRLLIGGFPCQDFSSSGPKVGFAGTRGRLYRVLVNYMVEHRPDIVVGENVPYLMRLENGKYIRAILKDFESCGYDFELWNIFCPDYGLSQSRRRLFLVGKRSDLPGHPELPMPSHKARHLPIEKAIGDLVRISDESVTNQRQYFVATNATAGGGQGDHTNRKGELAYCIRANAKARIQYHYELGRRLTVRECARLQSFPDEFVFPFAAMTCMSHIGNAVPPIVGHHVAQSVLKYLQALDAGLVAVSTSQTYWHEQQDCFAADKFD